MSVTARALAVRARVPADRAPLASPLALDLLAGGPIAHERVPVRWDDTAGLRALAAAKRAPLDPALARELADYHKRLGASGAARRSPRSRASSRPLSAVRSTHCTRPRARSDSRPRRRTARAFPACRS